MDYQSLIHIVRMSFFACCRYAGFLNKHAEPAVKTPCLQHFLNMLLLQQYVTFLRERGCSRATLAEQADVAIKVVTWLIHDNQLAAGGVQAAQGHLVLLKRLRHQLRTCLAPSPKKPVAEQVTAEHLTVLVQEVYDRVKGYATAAAKDIGIHEAVLLMRACMACLFWGFVQPLRSSGKTYCMLQKTPACGSNCMGVFVSGLLLCVKAQL